MQTATHMAVDARARANSTRPSADILRPWTSEDLLWLRILKSPHERLRPCDWKFLDERLGRPRREVRRTLIDLGLTRHGRRYKVNERFFDTWSPPMAWVLGLLQSDGHFGKKSAAIQFSSTDRELVEKARSCLDATHPIPSVEGGVGHMGDKPVHILLISRKRLRRGVDAVLPARLKANRRELPAMPNDLLRHFLRGYFEGDGSIFFDEPRKTLHVQVSGLTQFVEDIRVQARAAGLEVPPNLYRCTQAANTSTLHFIGAQAFRFADFLYHDVTPALALERKRAVYLQCLESRRARGLELRHVI
jgi:hypothetical protein